MITLFDPKPSGNEYATFYFDALCDYGNRNGKPIRRLSQLSLAKDCALLILTDHLDEYKIQLLKNNNVKIVGLNVTDSSYISQPIRYAPSLSLVDLIFSLTGIQKVNIGYEMEVDQEFNVRLEERKFLDDDAWAVFDYLRRSGRLKSLPYVHWEKQRTPPAQSYGQRSQKVIIRGGNHMRRYILCLFLMKHGLLDCNSGFVTSPYFADDMVPQFRYCESCRRIKKKQGYFPAGTGVSSECTNPHGQTCDLSRLGEWNNRCPASFYEAASLFSRRHGPIEQGQLEKLLNARWLTQEDHLSMLARITFTADFKWLFSIYAAQRFWDAASVGCVNLLPHRTIDQDYFPDMQPGEHYLTFHESMALIGAEATLDESLYSEVSANAKALYDQWLKSTDYAINTNLLRKIFEDIEAMTST